MGMRLEFHDIRVLLKNYLEPILGVPVLGRIPEPRPSTPWIYVRRFGGTAFKVFDRPRVDIFAYAPDDELVATQLINRVRSELTVVAGTALLGPMCYAVTEFFGPHAENDPETEDLRNWISVQLSI